LKKFCALSGSKGSDANMRINTNNTNRKLIYPELSYLITGICFKVHNATGRFAKEKQYADSLEEIFKQADIGYIREGKSDEGNNIPDFIVEDKIVLELKAKRLVSKEDFYQVQRYLQVTRKKLGMLVNFRNRYLKPIRILRIETSAKDKFLV